MFITAFTSARHDPVHAPTSHFLKIPMEIDRQLTLLHGDGEREEQCVTKWRTEFENCRKVIHGNYRTGQLDTQHA
jgi:hypothetical protein